VSKSDYSCVNGNRTLAERERVSAVAPGPIKLFGGEELNAVGVATPSPTRKPVRTTENIGDFACWTRKPLVFIGRKWCQRKL
jgi:hypothetical protein